MIMIMIIIVTITPIHIRIPDRSISSLKRRLEPSVGRVRLIGREIESTNQPLFLSSSIIPTTTYMQDQDGEKPTNHPSTYLYPTTGVDLHSYRFGWR
jgi:hypothetical protein